MIRFIIIILILIVNSGEQFKF